MLPKNLCWVRDVLFPYCTLAFVFFVLGTGLKDKDDEEEEFNILAVVNLVIKALRTD